MILKDSKDSILKANGISFYDNSKSNVYYLCEYLPNKYLHNSNIEDTRSKEFVLGYKGKNEEVINKVLDFIKIYLGENFTITVVPSSQKDNCSTASHILAEKIIKEYGMSNNLIDGSCCLRRIKAVDSQHISKKERNINTHLNSIVVENREKIKGKKVLLLDDIVTTGISIQACIQLLKEAGADEIVAFVVGKTFNGYNKKPAFIFDLDQTLYDTSEIKQYRDSRNWKEACKLANKIKNKPYPGVKSFIENIQAQGIECCIVTKSPRNYAKIFADALGINNIVAYHDVKNKTNKLEAYLKAKQLLQIYERDIFVVGDEESDIVPAEKLSMNSIRITKEKSSAKYVYDTFEKFREEIATILVDNYNIQINEDYITWDKEIPF